MDSTMTLADLLTKYMHDRGIGPSRLAEQVNRLARIDDLVSRRSIENWRDGMAKSVRDWHQLVAIAAVLGLDQSRADELLRSGGLPEIRSLRNQVSNGEQHFLSSWSTAISSLVVSSPLQWETLRRAATKLTESELGPLRERFRSDLYVQREGLLQDFLQFISSKKTAFVVIGNSGVGKTSFILSLVERAQESQNLCFCVYDGARLSAEANLGEKVEFDLVRNLDYPEIAHQDIFTRIDQLELMRGKTLVVVFDAINENLSGRVLLQKIDQMVGEIKVPWLKVLITSRPEAWRSIKRGIPLADHRYYHSGEGTVNETRPEVVLESFQDHELMEAYDKYRLSFALDVNFDKLTGSLKSALRDPWILSLIGETFRGRIIPVEIDVHDIYQLFIRGLMQTERLYEEDLHFLESELMPLMIDWDSYRNRISAEQIRSTTSLTGVSLLTRIRTSGSTTTTDLTATSYARLVDSGILLEQGPLDAYEISFKYERLFDYYAGRRLQALLDPADLNRTTALLGLIAALPAHAFLWGPLQRVMISEFQFDDLKSVVELAQAQDDIVKQLLVETMVEYGRDNPEIVRRVLEELLHLSKQRDSKLLKVRHSPDFDAPPVLRAKQIAIEVAANLAIPSILVAATCDPSAFIRNHALLFLQIMSQHTPEAAVQVVQSLGSRAVMRFGIPRPRTLESLIGASALVSASLSGKTSLLGDVQKTWQRVIDGYLGMNERNHGFRSGLNTSMRQMLLLFATKTMVSVLRTLVPPSSSVNFNELEHFVQQSAEDRSRYDRLLPFLDPQHGPWVDAYQDMTALYDSRDMLTTELLAMLILIGWGKTRLHEMIDFATSLFENALGLDRPGPLAGGVQGAVYSCFTGDQTTDTMILETLQKFFWSYYRKSYGICWSDVAQYQRSNLERLIIANYQITGAVYPHGMQDYLLVGVEAGDFQLHRLLLGQTEGSTMSLGTLDSVAAHGYPGLALEIAGYLSRFKEDAILSTLYGFLARMRLRDRQSVDDLADFLGLDIGKLRASEASISAREIGDVAVLVASPIINGMHSYPIFYREVRRLLFQLSNCQSVSQIVQVFVKRMASLAYGSPILDHAADLPF